MSTSSSSSSSKKFFRKLGSPALALILGAGALLACSSTTDEEITDDALTAGGEWKQQVDERDAEIDRYFGSKAEAFDWFKNSPLGFNGVPYVLLPILMEMYPDVWGDDLTVQPIGGKKTSLLGLSAHVDDYEDGVLKPEAQRKHKLPYGMAFNDPAFGSGGKNYGPEGTIADNEHPIRTVFFSCGGCHTGRVVVDGKIKHLYGAPNTEVDSQMYSQKLLETAAKFADLSTDPPTPNTVQVLRLKAVLEKENAKAYFGKVFTDPSLKEEAQRVNDELHWLKSMDNLKAAVKALVSTALKVRLIYKTLPDANGSYPGAATAPQPVNLGPHPGRMDAYGTAAGLVALHAIGTPPKGSTPGFYEALSAKLSPTDPGFSFFGQPIPQEIQVPTTEEAETARRNFLKPIVLGNPVGSHTKEWLPTKAAMVDIKSLYMAGDRFHAGWDGNQGNDARVIASGTSAVGDPTQVNRRIHAPMNALINNLPAPLYPFAVDTELAEEGKPVFERECATCHKPKNDRIYTVAELGGIDANRANIMTETARKGLVEVIRRACNNEDWCLPKDASGRVIQDQRVADNEYYREIRPENQRGYKADTLHGIWSQAPYLHNGSVPTLRDMLSPVAARPRKFIRGNINYDVDKVGFISDAAPGGRHNGRSPNPTYDFMRAFEFDTTQPGQSNAGHIFGSNLAEEDKSALLEYLKTL